MPSPSHVACLLMWRVARYLPLFPYFQELTPVAFRVLADGFVTDDSGTGVVHCAPAFGEDDYRVCLANGIIQKVCCERRGEKREAEKEEERRGVLRKGDGTRVRVGSVLHGQGPSRPLA